MHSIYNLTFVEKTLFQKYNVADFSKMTSLLRKNLHSNFFSAKMAEIHLKMVEYAQLDSTTIFDRTYAKIGRNVSKPVEFHPNPRKQTSHGSNFDQIERNSTKKGD
jgi:hypothetical protein